MTTLKSVYSTAKKFAITICNHRFVSSLKQLIKYSLNFQTNLRSEFQKFISFINLCLKNEVVFGNCCFNCGKKVNISLIVKIIIVF